jgi:3-phenylpropionate/trans-cinnamate dioxygenase ferredoxin subunit
MKQLEGWIEVCGVDDIDEEDVIRFDYANQSYAIYRTAQSKYYATDGFCTHGKFHLAEGLVMGNIIECPKHNGRFDITTGEAKRVPACINLKAFPVRIETNKIYLKID